MLPDIAFQQCINVVSSALRAEATQGVAFHRHATASVDGFAIEDDRDLSTLANSDLLTLAQQSPDLSVPFSPIFNPFRPLVMRGMWYDEGRLNISITEGPTLEHQVPSRDQLHVDAVAYGLTQYTVTMAKDASSDLIFILAPTTTFEDENGLWITYAAFSSYCSPYEIVLAGPNERRLDLWFNRSGLPTLSRVTFTEMLPIARHRLTLQVNFSGIKQLMPGAARP